MYRIQSKKEDLEDRNELMRFCNEHECEMYNIIKSIKDMVKREAKKRRV